MNASVSPKEFAKLLLSHHPDLPQFDSDVVKLWGVRVCAGCLAAYPVAAVALIVLPPLGAQSVPLALFIATCSQIRRFVDNSYIRFAFRMMAGLALGIGISGFLWAWHNNDIVTMFILLSGGVAYAAIRARVMYDKITSV